MHGPIVTSRTAPTAVYSAATQRVWFEPGLVPEQSFQTDQHWFAATYGYKIGYRTDPSVQWLGRKRPTWSYVWPTPYDAYGVTFEVPSFTFIEHRVTVNTQPWQSPWRRQNIVTRVEGLPPGFPIASASTIPDRKIEGSLINAARISVGDAKANLMMTLHELSQTVSMMRSRVKTFSDCVNLVRRGNYYGAARLLGLHKTPKGVFRDKTWANNFLEYQYGWKPLLSDILGYAEYFNDFLHELEFIEGVARVEVPGSVKHSTYTGLLSRSLPGYNYRVAWDTVPVDRHVVKLSFRLKDYLRRELGQLRLLDPMNTAFERVSMSFVWDWTIKVGEYLAATDAVLGLEFHSGSYTRSAKTKLHYTSMTVSVPPVSYPQSVVSLHSDLGAGISSSYVMKREVYQDVPPPELVFVIPGTSQSAVRQTIVSCALLRQRLSLPNNHFKPRKRK